MIDLRTDVLTPPTEEMWEAMRQAVVGWTLYRQDRAVNALEERGAELLGKQAALFLPTCGMANLLGLMTLGERGTQAVLESSAHIAVSEEGGIASVAGLLPRLVDGRRGVMDPKDVRDAIQSVGWCDGNTSPPYGKRRGANSTEERQRLSGQSSLVCLENSHNFAGGIALTVEQTDAVADAAHEHGAQVYMDGARLWNSAAALNVTEKRLVERVDAVGVSLNKGLCAPFGALLCGTREMVEAARVNAKRIGAASVHKAGIFAAAGLVALETMRERLREDNERAWRLAEKLAEFIEIDMTTVQTNIVFADVANLSLSSDEFASQLERRGVLVYARPGARVRFVTHRMIGEGEVEEAVRAVKRVVELMGARPADGESG